MNLRKLKVDFSNPRFRIGALIALISILGGWGYYHYVIGSLEKKCENLRVTHTKKKNELVEITSMKRQLGILREELVRYELQLDSLRSKFPDKKEIPKLIRDITRIARQSQVSTKKFNPLPDVEREFYIENNYAMAVAGGYHELAAFFSHMANMPLIINLSDMKMTTASGLTNKVQRYERHGGPLQTVEASFRMTTFSSQR
jgi:type IV pilus assembly protein PilO